MDQAINATSVFAYLNTSLSDGNNLDSIDAGNKLDAYGNDTYPFDLIDRDGDGKGDYVIVYPYTVHKITYAGTKSFTMDGSAVDGYNTFDYEDVDVYDGIAADDYVVVTSGVYTVDGNTAFAKAETVTGKVTGVKTGEVQIDGTWYKKNTTDTTTVDSSYDFTVVNGYIFAAVLTQEASSNVLFLSAHKTVDVGFGTTGTVEAQVYIGTEKQTVNIEKVDGSKIAASAGGGAIDDDTIVAGLYTYTTNGDGNYEIKSLNNVTNKAGYDVYNGAAGKFTASTDKLNSGISIADDAVVYLKNSASASNLCKR